MGVRSQCGIHLQNDFAPIWMKCIGPSSQVSPDWANLPWRDGGWTRKQILGHLLDSATNNRQRFVRAAIDGQYAGPKYAQDAWVDAHGYAGQPWETLLSWWETEHEILMAVVDHIPDDKLEHTMRRGR